jgi:hypothetical protein
MANTTPKNISFFLDEKKMSERTWTESEARAVPVIVAADSKGLDDAAFGFSSLPAFENWLAKNCLENEYAKGQALLDRSPKELVGKQEKKWSALQAKVVSEHGSDFDRILREAKLSHENISEVIDFVTNYNPYTGPILHSAILFQHIDSGGQFRYLPGGWTWPNFNWLNFNDTCSSLVCHTGSIFLWEHAFFKGRRIGMFVKTSKAYNINDYPFFFNDIASSAQTF